MRLCRRWLQSHISYQHIQQIFSRIPRFLDHLQASLSSRTCITAVFSSSPINGFAIGIMLHTPYRLLSSMLISFPHCWAEKKHYVLFLTFLFKFYSTVAYESSDTCRVSKNKGMIWNIFCHD